MVNRNTLGRDVTVSVKVTAAERAMLLRLASSPGLALRRLIEAQKAAHGEPKA
jgi:hypothetical protein